jgi:hypothetical protein
VLISLHCRLGRKKKETPARSSYQEYDVVHKYIESINLSRMGRESPAGFRDTAMMRASGIRFQG